MKRPDFLPSLRPGFARRKRRPWLWAIYAVLVLLVLPYGLTLAYTVVNPPSTLMLWRYVTGQRVEHSWVPLERIDPDLALAVIVAEDGRFCGHFGVDLTEIQKAIDDAEGFDDMRGGSTITQQVAKNLFLWHGRSYFRKVLELPLSLWIDLVLSKRRVLEIYLNIAEMGPDGEFGADAAAGGLSGALPRSSAPIRQRFWPRPCPIQRSGTPSARGRVCGGWRAFTSAARRARRRRRPACGRSAKLRALNPVL